MVHVINCLLKRGNYHSREVFFFFQVAKNTSYWPSVRHLKNIAQLPSVHNVQKVLGQYYVCFKKHFTIQILPVRPVYTCTQLMHALSVDIMGISSPDQFLLNYITHHTAVSILPCKACFPKRLYFYRKKGIRKEMGFLSPNPYHTIFTKHKPNVIGFVDQRYITLV